MEKKSDTKVEMVAPQAKVKMRVLRDCLVDPLDSSTIVLPGSEIEVDEERAKELEKPIKGHYAFDGMRGDHAVENYVFKRAVRV
jgi:hypothetical protein